MVQGNLRFVLLVFYSAVNKHWYINAWFVNYLISKKKKLANYWAQVSGKKGGNLDLKSQGLLLFSTRNLSVIFKTILNYILWIIMLYINC